MTRIVATASVVVAAFAVAALAAEPEVELQPGPGHDETASYCAVCHSVDYIPMNSPFLTPERWRAEVTKMRRAFGAPIDDTTADAIIRYLSDHYAAPPKA